MFEPTTSLSLHRLSRHSLQDRYESDEEVVSESDTGPQDLLSSPVGSRAEIFDSDLSADENSHADPDSDREENVLPPPTVKRARPVSSATIKRNSEATFDADTYVFDPEEQMVLELPPSDSPPQLASSTFLQPSVYVWPKQPQSTSRSRSSSPSSVFSVEEADIQVAKEVTITEPGTRPTVVLINALGSLPKTSKSRPSHSRSRESSRSRSRSVLVRADSRRLTMQRLSDPAKSQRASEKRSTMKQAPKTAPTSTSAPAPALEEDTQFAPSATINRVSQISPVLYFPAPPRTVPTQGYRARPQTSGFDKAMPPPLSLRTRRPPSLRSISSNSVSTYTSRPSTPFSAEDANPHNNDAPPSQLTRPCSPASISSPSSYISSKRVPSTYSVSNILTSRSPLMMRRMTRKHSASSVNSLSSLRSEVGVNGPSSSQISVATQPTPLPSADCHVVRKSSRRRHTRHASVLPSGRGFMGLKLGKRSHTKA
ncbi:hypothetical protein N7537_005764 [Penicillium hordei]|uniref:Uncharacterized protein n=1 Tax=Penicillium hordei TaxID=40994 RepID=A0AAD6E6Q4_9EURO|nr:uncharacterized protein N7537_005764 [Penicillium hordei]KAJ5602808.1 hypothetical protein N7537_005764 [Penicillium hordei]